MTTILILGLISYFVAAFYDSVKIKEKHYLFQTYGRDVINYTSRPYFHHKNNWHYGCTFVWIVLLSTFAVVYDWRVLFMALSPQMEDLFYYVIHYFYFKEFLPSRLDWLADGKYNPIRWLTGGKVTKLQFIVILIMELSLSIGLILWSM
jgi:hypothetical protein